MTHFHSKSVAQLKKIAQKHFNKWIRERDEGKPCISCGNVTTLEAGHYFPVGGNDALRFDEMNAHGQCASCNRFRHGNISFYRIGLVNRYGEEYVTKLEQKALYFKRQLNKWDRSTLIDIINRYK